MALKQKGDGVEAADALFRAAQLLDRARFPVIGGLLTDIDGAAAALALAKKLFASAHLLFKDGALVVREGEVVNVTWGNPTMLPWPSRLRSSGGSQPSTTVTLSILQASACRRRSPGALTDLRRCHV
jgi:hypothetical protein